MLTVELRTQVLRLRSLIAFACLAAVPVVAGLANMSQAGHRDGTQTGLFGAATYSALNHSAASLQFIAPLLLPLVVALLASAIGSADRDCGILRYLYVQPVGRRRLLAGKLAAVLVTTVSATGCVLVSGLVSGLALFGWHDFHIIGAPALTTAEAATRFAAASAYTVLCMLSIAAIAFTLGLALPNGAEALGVAVAFVIGASILSGTNTLHPLQAILSVHYWQEWTTMFDPVGTAHLGVGTAVQLATTVVAVGAAATILLRRNPAA